MIQVNYHKDNDIPEEKMIIAIIAAKYEGKWLFCRHKERITYEMPAGHREKNEHIDDTANRELYEETGAIDFTLHPISVYSVTQDNKTDYGKLFYAEIKELKHIPEFSEMATFILTDTLPENLTYPFIQRELFNKACSYINKSPA